MKKNGSGRKNKSRDDSGKFGSERHEVPVKSIRMPNIMGDIGSLLRQDHFEIENSKDKKKTFGFQREKKVSYKGSRIR